MANETQTEPVDLLRALDAAIDVCDRSGWELPGHAPARFVAKELGREEVGVEWDYGGHAWRPSHSGVAAVARALRVLEREGLVAIVPGYPALYALTAEGDALIAEAEAA